VIAEEDDVAEAVQARAARRRLERVAKDVVGTVRVPGNRMWPVGGLSAPSGT
jgi:hypothetical protein